MESVEDKVKAIVLEILDVKPSDVVPTARFIDDLGATSIDLVEILTALQNTFDMNITDEEAQEIKAVQDAVTFTKTAIANKKAKA